MVKRGLIIFWLLLCTYSFFSFSLTDPNLVLSSWQPYWQFQQTMWQTFFLNEQLLTAVYCLLILLLMGVYIQIVRLLFKSSLEYQVSRTRLVLIYAALLLPLLVSYNALSHDVFNYIFNAKMVSVYQTNPHIHTALEFARDDWTRFMHNTHTPAPYGYGWTTLSLIPYWLGFGKFTLTWLLFRVWSILSIGFLYFAIQHAFHSLFSRKARTEELAMLFLNPFLLLEVVSNMHNDLWMMAAAVLAVSLFWRVRGKFWGEL